jgi:hypothetical protein
VKDPVDIGTSRTWRIYEQPNDGHFTSAVL